MNVECFPDAVRADQRKRSLLLLVPVSRRSLPIDRRSQLIELAEQRAARVEALRVDLAGKLTTGRESESTGSLDAAVRVEHVFGLARDEFRNDRRALAFEVGPERVVAGTEKRSVRSRLSR